MQRFAVAIGAVAVLAVAVVATALAATTGDERIYACVNNGDGSMRQVAGPDVACPKGWHKLSWSQENAPPAPVPTPPPTTALTTYVKTAEQDIDAHQGTGVTVNCDSGDVMTGGGARPTPGGVLHTGDLTAPFVNGTEPGNPPTGIVGQFFNTLDFTSVAEAYVICLDTTP